MSAVDVMDGKNFYKIAFWKMGVLEFFRCSAGGCLQ